jgi:hypothetical protein
VALGVGNGALCGPHDPEPLPEVGGTGVGSSQHSPPDIKPQRGQVTDDGAEVPMRLSKETWDVLQQHPAGSNDAKDIPRLWPQVPVVVGPETLARDRERLAWESGRNDVNQALIRLGVPFTDECSDIAEDRGLWDESVFDSLGDDSLTVVIGLYVPYRGPAQEMGPKEPTAGACEQGEFIHIHLLP